VATQDDDAGLSYPGPGAGATGSVGHVAPMHRAGNTGVAPEAGETTDLVGGDEPAGTGPG
jgi:hypothetical protein